MNRDMDSLQTSEQALEKLQKQLEEAKQSEVAAISEKQNLERLLQDSRGDMASLTSAYSESDITHYKEEIKSLKAQIGELTQAAFKNTCYGVPPGLQQWLQLTYELEQKSFDKKKVSAEKQLQQAREAVSSFFHSLFFFIILKYKHKYKYKQFWYNLINFVLSV